MKPTIGSGTVERNNAGASQPWAEPISGGQGVGNAAQNPPGLGAGHAQTTRFRSETPAANPRRGGQTSSPGLFGLRIDGGTGSVPAAAAIRSAAQTAPQSRPAASGLSFGQRRARLRLLMHHPRPVADEFEGYGLGRPCTPAMRLAARASDQHEQRDWHELADTSAGALNLCDAAAIFTTKEVA